MRDKILKDLYDIDEAIDSINSYLVGKKDFSVYQKDKQLRRAIKRELEIIGEAANKMLQINPEIKIENARRIVDLRNSVIHGYDKVDDVIVWAHLNSLCNGHLSLYGCPRQTCTPLHSGSPDFGSYQNQNLNLLMKKKCKYNCSNH
jgi:uncharacterized protein with HEPN domain